MESRGSAPAGPSPEYRALLRGEINSKEYVEALKRRVHEEMEADYPRVRSAWWRKLFRVH